MPSFSKAFSFLMVLAMTASITTTTTVDAACECIGAQADTSKIFVEQGWPADLGAYCQPWEVTTTASSCSKGGADYGSPWCTGSYCYVGADNTCDDSTDTVTFADTSIGDTLKASLSACSIRTCGQCLPIMEGDDAVIGIRLYRTSLPAEECLANVDEIFTPFYSTQPGFISYTGVATQDPGIVMFVSIYDTLENSAAAWDKSKLVHTNELSRVDADEELLKNYYGTITWTGDDITGTTDNCVKSFDVGDYLSARMFHEVNDLLEAAGDIDDNYRAWTAVESFDSYTQSVGAGEFVDESFYFETFNDQDDSINANAFALEHTALVPSISLIYNVVGRVVFDSSCSNDYPDPDDDDDDDDDNDDDTCETVEEIIKSNPSLAHFANLFDVAQHQIYSIYTDTYTVFAPTDEAIESAGLAIDAVSNYSAIRLLLFHEVKDQVVTTSDLNCDAGDNLIEMGPGQATRTICSKGIPIGQKGGGNGSPALFVGNEIVGCNGVVHIIDKVLLPPSTVSWYSGLGLD